MPNQKLLSALRAAVAELNEARDDASPLGDELSTPLIGKEAPLSSLELVNLIVIFEQEIEDALDVSITLADERAMQQEKSPFRTLGTLLEYATLLVSEADDGSS